MQAINGRNNCRCLRIFRHSGRASGSSYGFHPSWLNHWLLLAASTDDSLRFISTLLNRSAKQLAFQFPHYLHPHLHNQTCQWKILEPSWQDLIDRRTPVILPECSSYVTRSSAFARKGQTYIKRSFLPEPLHGHVWIRMKTWTLATIGAAKTSCIVEEVPQRVNHSPRCAVLINMWWVTVTSLKNCQTNFSRIVRVIGDINYF